MSSKNKFSYSTTNSYLKGSKWRSMSSQKEHESPKSLTHSNIENICNNRMFNMMQCSR